MTRQTFQLNGRTYDALTGAIIPNASASATSQAAAKAHAAARRPAPTASMDGMVAAKPAIKLNVPASHTAHRITAKPASHVSAHKPQATKTLMRRAVKAPTHGPAKTQANTTVSHVAVRPARGIAPTVTPKLSASKVHPRHTQAALNAQRTHAVRHFGAAMEPKPWSEHLAKPVATSVAGVAATQQPTARTTPIQPKATAGANRHNTFASPTRRPSAAHAKHQPAAHHDEDDSDLFAQALAQARSHEEAAPKNVKKTAKGKRRTARILAIAGSAAIFSGLVGFVAFQNRDDIRLQLASAKAGFSASSPLYKPDGFALSSMQYTTGSVASVYQHDNDQNFTITQKKSNWDSQTLLENFVATKNGDYKGFQSNGRTIYVYGDGNATWVNGGIWYQIKDTSSMDDEQLVRIAASM